jgi:hypothetical protein
MRSGSGSDVEDADGFEFCGGPQFRDLPRMDDVADFDARAVSHFSEDVGRGLLNYILHC